MVRIVKQMLAERKYYQTLFCVNQENADQFRGIQQFESGFS